MYKLATMHEDTMQAERTPALDEYHVKKLFFLLLISMGLSFAALVRSPRQQIEAYRSKVARRDAPHDSRQVLKPIKAAPAGQSKQIEAACTDQSNQVEQLGPIDAANTSQSKHIEAARAGPSRQIEQPGLITWLRASPCSASWASSVSVSREYHYRYIWCKQIGQQNLR